MANNKDFENLNNIHQNASNNPSDSFSAGNGQNLNNLLNNRGKTGYGNVSANNVAPQTNAAKPANNANNGFGDTAGVSPVSSNGSVSGVNNVNAALNAKPQNGIHDANVNAPKAAEAAPKPTTVNNIADLNAILNKQQNAQSSQEASAGDAPLTKQQLQQQLAKERVEKAMQEAAKKNAANNAAAAAAASAAAAAAAEAKQLAKDKTVSKQEIDLQKELANLEKQQAQLLQQKSAASAAASKEALSTDDYFAQLEALNKINTDVTTGAEENPELSEIDARKAEILAQLEALRLAAEEEEEEEEKKKRGFFWWWWIILLLLLLLLIGGISWLIYDRFNKDDYDYVRISLEILNEEEFVTVNGSGDKIPITVSPGDTYDFDVVASNSKAIGGDDDTALWNSLFVRYKIWLTVDGIDYYGVLFPTVNSNNWHKYNAEQESQYTDSYGNPLVAEDDGYFYYKGMLGPNSSVQLMSEINFGLYEITDSFAGKQAEINVQVEVLEDAFGITTYWSSAPYAWKMYLADLGIIV